jgi:hypothetical protein
MRLRTGPPVWVFVYQHLVEPGTITGVTYGLSHFKHPDSDPVTDRLST